MSMSEKVVLQDLRRCVPGTNNVTESDSVHVTVKPGTEVAMQQS
jgi:hypothetical protein